MKKSTDYLMDQQENFLEDLIDIAEVKRSVSVIDGLATNYITQGMIDATDPWWKENIKPMAITFGDYKRLSSEELKEKGEAIFREVKKIQDKYKMSEEMAFNRHQEYSRMVLNIR